MRLFDLTQPIMPSMTVFPGSERPEIVVVSTLAQDGFRESRMTITSHCGTHLDAPAHMLSDGRTLDGYPIDKFYGKACIYRHLYSRSPVIGVGDLQTIENLLELADFLLIVTGWDSYWGTVRYLRNFPVLDQAAAGWLRQFSLKGIGLDTISADPIDTDDCHIHRLLLASDCLIIENLRGVTRLPGDGCLLQCFPLALAGADGAPARVVAMID
ncbi:MAG: cyclase family protein [Desulfopila sp.]